MRAPALAKGMAAAISLLLCAGCIHLKELFQQGVARTRTPGQQMVESCESALKRHCCPPYRENEVYVEEAVAIPERLLPGEEVNHRMRYSFCPQNRTGVMHARMVRRVLYHGREVFNDVSNQEFCAGTWNVDAFIMVPRNALPGRYTIRLEIYCDGKTIKRASSFYVKKNKMQSASYNR